MTFVFKPGQGVAHGFVRKLNYHFFYFKVEVEQQKYKRDALAWPG